MKNVWTAIFQRKGGDGAFTRLFDHLEPRQRTFLLGKVMLDQAELPVIGSLRDPTNWLLLTTGRLAWSIEGQPHELAVNTVRDATADLAGLKCSGRSKLEMRHLQVLTMENGQYSIELEAGLPLSGTWHVLKNLGDRNRSSSTRSV